MAIDTAAKRRSAGGLPFPLGPGVTPVAAKGLAWRQQAGRGYSGIAIAVNVALTTAAQRRAASGVPFLPITVAVTPNASKGIVWRAQSGWSYGPLFEAAVGTGQGGSDNGGSNYPGARRKPSKAKARRERRKKRPDRTPRQPTPEEIAERDRVRAERLAKAFDGVYGLDAAKRLRAIDSLRATLKRTPKIPAFDWQKMGRKPPSRLKIAPPVPRIDWHAVAAVLMAEQTDRNEQDDLEVLLLAAAA